MAMFCRCPFLTGRHLRTKVMDEEAKTCLLGVIAPDLVRSCNVLLRVLPYGAPHLSFKKRPPSTCLPSIPWKPRPYLHVLPATRGPCSSQNLRQTAVGSQLFT